MNMPKNIIIQTNIVIILSFIICESTPEATNINDTLSNEWSRVSAVDLTPIHQPVLFGTGFMSNKISTKYFTTSITCKLSSYRHRHQKQRNDLELLRRADGWRSNIRCTGRSLHMRWCCKRRRRQQSSRTRFTESRLQTTRSKWHNNDVPMHRSFLQMSNSRSKRHKHSDGFPGVTPLSSIEPLLPPGELHLQSIEENSIKSMGKINRKNNRKHASNDSTWSKVSESRIIDPPTESPRNRSFVISLGQVIPRRQKPLRHGQRRQNVSKLRRLNMSTNHQSEISSTNESTILFEGVKDDKREELAQLLAEEDFETALMEFIELAYQDTTMNNKRATVFHDSTVDIKLTNKKFHDKELNDDFAFGVLKNDRTSDETTRCGLKLNYDASKLVDLQYYFRNQLLKITIFSNSISSYFLSKPQQIRDKLDDQHLSKLLKTFIQHDFKMAAAALAFDPSQLDFRSISPYVVKTRKRSRKSDKSTEGKDGFVLHDVSILSKDRYALDGFKGYEWFWRLRLDYSHILWKHDDVCLQNSTKEEVMISINSQNESYWGPIQSDCLIRRLDETNRDRLPAPSMTDERLEEFAVWTIVYSVPIFGCGKRGSPVFLGVLKVDLDLTDLEFDQCLEGRNQSNSFPLLFHLTHNCPQHMQCQHVPQMGFRRGAYRCLCTPGAPSWTEDDDSTSEETSNITTIDESPNNSTITTNSTPSVRSTLTSTSIHPGNCYLDGMHLERCYLDQFFNKSFSRHATATSRKSYNVCRECLIFVDGNGCPSSFMYDHHRNHQLLDDYNYWMRGLPLGIQCFTILTGFTIAVMVARLKKNRVMVNSVWILLELNILGAIILHFSVILAYFDCTPTNCIVIVWCREIGFLLVYGALLLKLHRTLSEFQSRKAHRVQWRDRDLVKCLLFMVVILIFSLASWTAGVVDSLGSMADLLSVIRVEPRKIVSLSFSLFSTVQNICRLSIKDRLLEAGELLFLSYTAYMCYKTRKAPIEFFETRYITFCVLNETLVSVIYYSFRYFSNTILHPDYMFIAFFVRCHVTTSTTITLVVCSKLWYSCWPPRDSRTGERTRSYSAAPSVDSRAGPVTNPSSPPASPPVQSEPSKSTPSGNWDLCEFDIANSTAEDIRYELRKLYTQLQIYKTKTMRQDNPHISKRRGGKKQTNRKFSFQTLHSKYKQQSSFSSSHAVAATPSGSVGFEASVGGGDHGEHSMATVGGDAELSVRSPEDSSNSMEGVSVYMDEGSYASPEVAPTAETTKKHRTLKKILSAARNKSKRSS